MSALPRRVPAVWIAVLLAVAGPGCSTKQSAAPAASEAPRALAYSAAVAVYRRGVPIDPNLPVSGGGAVSAYHVTPALPSGLALDPVSGIITGTPTGVAARALYTVTASNAAGSDTASLDVTVTDVPPAALRYGTETAAYPRSVAIAPNAPASEGGAPTGYAVDPPLPAGLALDAATGVITGTPTAVTAAAWYRITASNSGGSDTLDLRIAVVDAPPAFTYERPVAVYRYQSSIPPNHPVSTGGAATSWSILPALPAGLALDPATGVISGSPTEPTESGVHVVTATNAGGNASSLVEVAVRTASDPSAAYVANPGDGTISVYGVQGQDVVPLGYLHTGETPVAVAADPGGRYLYAGFADPYFGYRVRVLGIDPDTGRLSPLSTNTPTCRTLLDLASPAAGEVWLSCADGTSSFHVLGGPNSLYRWYGQGAAGAAAFDPRSGSVFVPTYAGTTSTIEWHSGQSGSVTAQWRRYVAAAVDPLGRYVYAADALGGVVDGYRVGAFGALTPAASSASATETQSPATLEMDPWGRVVFAVNPGQDDVQPFAIDFSGRLTPMAPIPAGAGAAPSAAAVDQGGRLLLVANGGQDSVSTFSLDTASGAPTFLATLAAGLGPSDVTFAYGGRANAWRKTGCLVVPSAAAQTLSTFSLGFAQPTFVASVATAVQTGPVGIDPVGATTAWVPTTGGVALYALDAGCAPALRATVAVGAQPTGATPDPTGRFVYVVAGGAVGPWAIGGGTLTQLPGSQSTGGGARRAVFHPGGRALYVVNTDSETVTAYAVDPATGALAALGAVATGARPSAVAIDPSGQFAYVTNEADGTVSTFAVRPGGALVARGAAFPVPPSPTAISIEPGRAVVTHADAAGSVTGLDLDRRTGAIARQGALSARAGAAPAALVFVTGRSVIEQYAYVAEPGARDLAVLGAWDLSFVGTVGVGAAPSDVAATVRY